MKTDKMQSMENHKKYENATCNMQTIMPWDDEWDTKYNPRDSTQCPRSNSNHHYLASKGGYGPLLLPRLSWMCVVPYDS